MCELEEIAAAKIGASEETVPSIIPTSAGLHDAQHEVALVLEARSGGSSRAMKRVLGAVACLCLRAHGTRTA